MWKNGRTCCLSQSHIVMDQTNHVCSQHRLCSFLQLVFFLIPGMFQSSDGGGGGVKMNVLNTPSAAERKRHSLPPRLRHIAFPALLPSALCFPGTVMTTSEPVLRNAADICHSPGPLRLHPAQPRPFGQKPCVTTNLLGKQVMTEGTRGRLGGPSVT